MNEVELAFCETLNCDRESLYLNKESFLDKDKSAELASVLERRAMGEPIQYILGKAEFMGLEFKVTPDVLIPRPETEVLVETALKMVSRWPVSRLKILDIGTGSGSIAVSLAKSLPLAEITAADISKKALAVARENALLNKVGNIGFIQSDLFFSYELSTISYELIVFNPPYIPSAEISRLQPELRYEPRAALDGGKDGLDFYRRIIKDAADYLIRDGFLIMEIGYDQPEAVKNILLDSKKFEIIEFVKDYNNIKRVAVAKRIAEDG